MSRNADDSFEGIALAVASQHTPQSSSKRAASPRKAKQSPAVRQAQSKFGALVRSLHTLGVYDKLRVALTQIEKAIKDAT